MKKENLTRREQRWINGVMIGREIDKLITDFIKTFSQQMYEGELNNGQGNREELYVSRTDGRKG